MARTSGTERHIERIATGDVQCCRRERYSDERTETCCIRGDRPVTFLVVVVLVVAVGLGVWYYLSLPQCPYCGSRSLRPRHMRKDGQPDRRYNINPTICTSCGKVVPDQR